MVSSGWNIVNEGQAGRCQAGSRYVVVIRQRDVIVGEGSKVGSVIARRSGDQPVRGNISGAIDTPGMLTEQPAQRNGAFSARRCRKLVLQAAEA